jgi:20S proteasome subunit alpha 7
VEYAKKAVDNSSTAIGIKGKDGVVLGVEKLIMSKLHEPSSNRRIMNIDRHVGMTMAGLLTDARQVATSAREESSDYRAVFGGPIPLRLLTDRVSMFMHAYTLYSVYRPFGCSVMLGSYEADGPHLYMVEPSGVAWGYHACAIGKARQAAKTELEKLKPQELTCQELVKEVAKIIHMVHDEVKDKDFILELSWVGEMTGGRHELVPAELVEEAERLAKMAMEESGSEDEDL